MLALLLFASWQYVSHPAAPIADDRVMEATESDTVTSKEDETCEGHDWDGVTTISVEASNAVKQALDLVGAKRQKCMVSLGQINTPPKDWLQGVNHTHSVHVEQKCLKSQKAKAYKLHFHVNAGDGTTFMIELHQDMTSKVYSWVTSDPAPCDIRLGGASGPQNMNTKSKRVTEMGKFAVIELSNKASSCLPGGATAIRFSAVKEAISQVTYAFVAHMEIEAKLEGGSESSTTFQVSVMQRCADPMTNGRCINQLSAPDGDICKVFEEPATGRRLERLHGTGGLPEELSEIMDTQRRYIDTQTSETTRRLGSAKPPLMQRHIRTGSVPASFDPRNEECYKNVAVYDQGACGSCYANAWASMMGIRKCLQDKGRRRLHVLNDTNAEEGEEAFEGASDGTAPVRSLSGCQDSSTWSYGSVHDCAWFAKHDSGCTYYKDYGQLTSCRQTCGTCPKPVSQSTSANPWHGAWYHYMPSVSDLAPCAKNADGVQQGCNGGNPNGLWNEDMAKQNRDLNIMGEKCLPYKMKCTESSGVVNPLAGGVCSKYTGYELWHKPCSCIPGSQRPTSATCPSSVKPGCGFTPPPRAFVVTSVAQGLSVTEAMNNLMRHINEFGPLFISFATTTGFMDWDWKSKPVYTGGGHVSGGHVVLAMGWGTSNGLKYWLLRNSWGADWADGGHCKFHRGVNLDTIEARGAAVTMAHSNFKDWSPPECFLDRWSWSYSYNSAGLLKMNMNIQIKCDKAATLRIFASNLLTNRDAIYSGVSGRYYDLKANAGVNNLNDVNLICRGFGLRTGDMWLSIKADDGKGNTADSTHFVSLNRLTTVSTIASSARSACR
jgi:hypothetical protein